VVSVLKSIHIGTGFTRLVDIVLGKCVMIPIKEANIENHALFVIWRHPILLST